MIDKKELIADLEMNKSEMHPARNGQHPVSIEVIIDYIKGFPTVGDWIPCSERLPDETDYPEQHFRILASCSDGIVRNATIKSLRQTEEKHMNRGYYFTYVAWMPLPEPYRG